MADYDRVVHQQAILKLLNEYAQHPMGGGVELAQTTKQSLIENLKQVDGAFSVLAFDKQQAVALANCFMGFSTFAAQPLINIHDLIVTHPLFKVKELPV